MKQVEARDEGTKGRDEAPPRLYDNNSKKTLSF